MQNLVTDELTIRVDLGAPGLLRLVMSGKSSSREPGKVLIPFFAEALKHAADSKESIEVHFEELSHFNSSTIAAVIQFINASQERQIALALHYDATLKWQALSFEALMRAIRPFESFSASKVRFVEVTKR
ncbi:MAG: hypothetical protein ACYC8T_15320 [Myxococcaceae bacterium]